MSERRRYIVDGDALREALRHFRAVMQEHADADPIVRALTPQADGGEAVEVPLSVFWEHFPESPRSDGVWIAMWGDHEYVEQGATPNAALTALLRTIRAQAVLDNGLPELEQERDALRAEVARLTMERDQWRTTAEGLAESLAVVRQQVDSLRDARALDPDVRALVADAVRLMHEENARLKVEVDSLAESRLRCEQGWNAAIADVERLTAERDHANELTVRAQERCKEVLLDGLAEAAELRALRGLATNERAVEAVVTAYGSGVGAEGPLDTTEAAFLLQAAIDAVSKEPGPIDVAPDYDPNGDPARGVAAFLGTLPDDEEG